jgi:hypothetical protein
MACRRLSRLVVGALVGVQCLACAAVPRQNLIRLAQEHRDPSLRPRAQDPEPSGGKATGIVRPSALHGHTGVAMEDGERAGWAAELDL